MGSREESAWKFSDKGGQAETGTAYAERLYPSCRTRSRGQSARGLRLLRLERTRPPGPVLQSLILAGDFGEILIATREIIEIWSGKYGVVQ